MVHDPWLTRWLPRLKASTHTCPVLEIGCGTGADTVTLAGAGLSVVAFDRSPMSVTATRVRAPRARVTCQDIRDPFPLGEGAAGAVVASLSLHYFTWNETLDIVERIRQTLSPGGLLLCRLNSTADANFGATGHPAIEPHYFLVDGQPKRFFDERQVDDLFASGWELLSKEHHRTGKYLRPKALWEIAAVRSD
jgi:SAM-dependent methyltransferase